MLTLGERYEASTLYSEPFHFLVGRGVRMYVCRMRKTEKSLSIAVVLRASMCRVLIHP
jgi:hypothetical protein